jgi:uncharacterized protein
MTKTLAMKHLLLTKNLSTRDFLYHGLPCVWNNSIEKFVIFSPYARKSARVEAKLIPLEETKRKLEKLGFFGRPSVPGTQSNSIKIGLILTNGCNLQCKYCYVDQGTKMLSMSEAYATRIIQDNIQPNMTDLYIYFFGGEPTLNMRTLKTVVEYVKGLKFPVHFIINTNGTVPNVLDYLIDNNFVIGLSSDGIPAATDYHRSSKQNALVSEFVERAIQKLVDAKAIFQVRATITKWNVSLLKEGIRYWASLGVRFVHLEPVGPSFDSTYFIESRPDRDEYVSAMLSAVDEAEKLRIYIINSAYMNLMTPSTYFCTMIAREEKLYTPDGAISLCYRIQNKKSPAQEFIIGMYNPLTGKFQRDMNHNKSLNHIEVSDKKPCSNCHARYICAGGCPYRNKEETGNIFGIDPWMCSVKKALVHDAIIRIDNSINTGKVPVVLGQRVFENIVAENPIIER